MSQYRIPDAEELLECPYDRVHMVRAKRFQYHLMKCRNNYTGREYVSCPFNAKHEMPKPELRHHLITCPDKALLEPELKYAARREKEDGTLFKGCTDTPAYNNFEIPCTEDWDEEAAGPARVGIDPSFYSRVKFKDLTGMSASEKKLMKDWSLPLEEKMKKLAVKIESTEREDDSASGQLRLPKSSSIAAMPQHPVMKPKPQPESAVFAYSIGRGRGVTAQNNAGVKNNDTFVPAMSYGRGRGQTSSLPGLGRGMVPLQSMPTVGSSLAPPPGFSPAFVVPNVNDVKNEIVGEASS